MLPKHDMRYLRGLEFDGLRRELPVIADAAPMLNAHRDANLRLNLLVDAPEPTFAVERCRRAAHFLRMENARREEVAIEVGQRWDVRNRYVPPQEAGRIWRNAALEIENELPDAIVITGGISSLSDRSLWWVSAALDAMGREVNVSVGFQPYRPNRAQWDAPDRGVELRRLHRAAMGRRLWCTEVGWHTAPRPRKLPFCFIRQRWSEKQVGDFLFRDVLAHTAASVEAYTVRELDDGPNNVPSERFGIRKRDGKWKEASLMPLRFRTRVRAGGPFA